MAYRHIPTSIRASVLQQEIRIQITLPYMSHPLLYLSRAYLIRYTVLLLLCSGMESYANIHKCVSNEGVEYSDTHCSIGILVKHSPDYRTMGSIEGLSSLELENLDKLERAYKKSSLASERQRSAQKKTNGSSASPGEAGSRTGLRESNPGPGTYASDQTSGLQCQTITRSECPTEFTQ